MNKQDIIITAIIFFIVIAAGGSYVYLRWLSPQQISVSNNAQDGGESNTGAVSDIDDPADMFVGSNEDVDDDVQDAPDRSTEGAEGMRKMHDAEDDETLEDRIKDDPDVLKAELVDVTGGSSSGTAYVLRKDGQLFHTVTARLPEPEGDDFYEGWLVKQLPRLTFFSTGRMRQLSDGRYFLALNADEEYPDFDQVVITIETVDDGEPERHVIEGTVSRSAQ
ncbi:MAG: anti-sigma factor [Patescibacteria group bacterium]